jgi:hypothetical protein
VLTSHPAEKISASWPIGRIVAAILVSVATLTPARAAGIGGLSCVGSASSFNCVGQWGLGSDPYVRTVPETLDEGEKAQAAARDHKWLTRCRPVVERDIYGVGRYQYSAPGCEYGLGAD